MECLYGNLFCANFFASFRHSKCPGLLVQNKNNKDDLSVNNYKLINLS